ncbi:hypothetical protein OS035_24320 [Rhizobium sp. 268]|uniref:hypothetical protein n=1 Tax=Rhizobium sp. 268 TaxID=2996375 RepID=UPI002F94850E
MARSTLPELEGDRFPENPEGIDAILKVVVKAMVESWTCETPIASSGQTPAEARIRRPDRKILDLVE